MDLEPTLQASESCLTPNELTSLAHGATAPAVAQHLASCTRCSAIVNAARTQDSGPTGASAALPAGTMVGRYRIETPIGRGGMGIVYRAIDTELDRAVALKLVHPNSAQIDELTERLRRESRLQARAAHGSVITVHDIGRDGDLVYMAMELVSGGTLREWLAGARRSTGEIIDVMSRAGHGLAAAHAAGLVHRDFKPENVLVELRDGAVTRVLVIDFGVARAFEASERATTSRGEGEVELTAAGALIGTPAYMAPEQLAAAPVDPRTDVFAFGVVFWEALRGTRPYTGRSVAELVMAMTAPLPVTSRLRDRRIPRWLDDLVRQALAQDPGQRFASMSELIAELDSRPRRRLVVGAAAAIAIAGIAGLAAASLALGGDHADAEGPSPCELDPPATARLHEVAARLRRLDGDQAARTAAADALVAYADTTQLLRARACTFPRPANWRDRVDCFDRAAASRASIADHIVDTSPVTFSALVYMAPATPPYECAGDAAAIVAAQLPGNAAACEASAAVDVGIFQAHILGNSGAATALLDGVTARLPADELARRRYEIAFARIQVAADSLHAAGDAATSLALGAEHDGQFVVAARIWILIANEIAGTSDDSPRSRDLLTHSDVDLNRSGNPPFDRARWHAARAYFAALASKPAETDAEVKAAEALMSLGPSDPFIVASLGIAELRAGNPAAALVRLERSYRDVLPMGLSGVRLSIATNYASALAATHLVEAQALLRPIVAARAAAGEPLITLAPAVSTLVRLDNQLGLYDQTIALVERWRAPIEQMPRSDAALGRLLEHYAEALFGVARAKEAEVASRRALEIHIAIYGASHYDTADARVLRAQILTDLGRFDEARDAAERGLADLTRHAGDQDPLAIQARVALADVAIHQHRAAEAQALIEPSLARYRQLDDDPATVAHAEMILAKALVEQHRDLSRARPMIARAIAVWSTDPGRHKELVEAKAMQRRLH